MSLLSTTQLPAQPTVGTTVWVPLGGDGVTAPLGYYDVQSRLVGDAGGGSASIQVIFDTRYTNLMSFANIGVQADTAATEFSLDFQKSSAALTSIQINGTMPFTLEASFTQNSSYMWYPPPVFFAGDGQVLFRTVNEDATETYSLTLQVFAYNRDVRNRMNMTWLHQISPSVNAPTAT